MSVALLEKDTETLIDSTDGTVLPRALGNVLHVRYDELAKMSGLKSSSLRANPRAKATQAKLRPIAQIILRASAMTGSIGAAVAWFEYQPIPGFGNKTPAETVADGYADAVLQHLDDMEEGVYA
ncbi:MAG: MbcA/ParS/Xre antitoxin family protein [Rhodospirillales bacterium]|nr:MbcA/ParS/Xre antitoxin family protein [Rhodospirillales bacterium]